MQARTSRWARCHVRRACTLPRHALPSCRLRLWRPLRQCSQAMAASSGFARYLRAWRLLRGLLRHMTALRQRLPVLQKRVMPEQAVARQPRAETAAYTFSATRCFRTSLLVKGVRSGQKVYHCLGWEPQVVWCDEPAACFHLRSNLVTCKCLAATALPFPATSIITVT